VVPVIDPLAYSDETVLLRRLPAEGWTIRQFGPDHAHVEVLAASRRADSGYTVVLIWSQSRAVAYRTPPDVGDPFAPVEVVWHYVGTCLSTLRALLRLSTTDEPFAVPYPMPAEYVLPYELRRWCVVRPSQ
jgi:hypothetical protein